MFGTFFQSKFDETVFALEKGMCFFHSVNNFGNFNWEDPGKK